MTVAVMQPPQRRGNTDQILDAIGKGLQIAQAVYGLKTDMAKYDEYKANQDLNRRAMEGDVEATEQLRRRSTLGREEPKMSPYEQARIDLEREKMKADAERSALVPTASKPKDDDGLSQKDIADLLGKGWMPGDGPGAAKFSLKGGKGTLGLIPPSKPDSGNPTVKMTESERAVTDKAAMGLEAIVDMRAAINDVAGRSGIKQVSERVKFLSDTPYTEARTRFTEALGRLQSGGVISKDEEGRFSQMTPGPLDSYAMSQIKLNKAYTELAYRLKSRGLDAEKVLAERREVAKGAPKLEVPRETGTATAAPGLKAVKEMTTEELLRELGQ